MDIRQLAYFLAIAEEKNISRAAERLHIAQPPLSQQLKLLENELGVKLMERSTRKIEITDVGETLQHRAKQILELVEATVKEVTDINKGLQGMLSIGSIASVGATFLTKVLYDFHKSYPGINFKIIDEDTEKITELLNSGVIDIGIVRTPVNKEVFDYISLGDDPVVAISDSFNFSSGQKLIKLTDLHNRQLILQRRYEKNIVNLCRDLGFEPKVLCRSNDVRTILMWASLGMGTAILPSVCTSLITNENLTYYEIDEPSLKIGTAVIWPKKRYLSSASRHLLEVFKTYCETSSI